MRLLVDTNVLLRSVQLSHPHHRAAYDAIHQFAAAQHELCVVPQVLYEFWAVATRPRDVNGIGLSPQQAEQELRVLLPSLTLLEDGVGLFSIWLRLVLSRGVSGKQTHDARLVAAMQLHQIEHILTFNRADFSRYPEVTIHEPA